ncbi:MAG: TetR/AcrR family transcriptional regulator [Neisseriaceae bacterium]|nr:TetR/AcrR family transcriptional regulator [Neisseriaceae bacterium]MBP6861148.1 TetR/AcrR family transcriptional regulator [Neisseriaceae bacterium]
MAEKPRGRPRAYDPERALEAALSVFWQKGYAGTSLDALAEATGMNRPSLYAGLGDKQTIYLKAMTLFQTQAQAHFAAALQPQPEDQSFADVICRYLHAALALEGQHEASNLCGCAVISTATAEALTDPLIRQALNDVLARIDQQLLNSLKMAQADGRLDAAVDVSALAFLLAATMQSIGLRARAGFANEAIAPMIKSLAHTLCPPPLR